MLGGNLASLGGVVAAALLGASAPAVAAPMLQNIVPFGDNRGAPTPPVARYVGADGQSFVLDRQSGPRPLLKFDDSPEVWVLEPSPAPRGDTIYRNDQGEPVLRSTRLGGLTLFSAQEPGGSPAAMAGEAEDLQSTPNLPPGVLLQRMIQASARASRAAQHLITFTAPNVSPQSAPLFADAATVAADALVRLARRADAHAFMVRLDKLVFVQGPKPDISINGPVMQVTITPGKGFAGRPSSDRFIHAALKR
ncbi:MAG: hypothetical protein JWO72_1386 [Caulobacteraceae bacterium]|nr:hypothetical protein [Caulobacteraceae bacterium]